ncbi:MAG: AAA family ATPase [Bacteroidota bacterium]|nr:AAA family ATPase [Bacteroidota bacterium]
MDQIYIEHKDTLASLKPRFRRDFMDEIDWNEPLLFILGARGVGKTTLILQHIKERFGNNAAALYISMDDLALSNYTLLSMAKHHAQNGGTHLFVDEIHKYQNWSQELKNIRDKIKELKVVVSGSSILDIYKGNADLSRRSVVYNLHGLSFREYLNIELKLNLPKFSLEEILKEHENLTPQLLEQFKPLQHFPTYLKYGYFPFYLEGIKNYHHKLGNVLNVVLEQDMALLESVDLVKIPKIRKLIYLLSTQVPYQPNITKLAETLEIDRITLLHYLNSLQKASVLNLVRLNGKLYTQLTKPDKIYLQNTNLLYLSQSAVNIGTLRETFFANQVGINHQLTLAQQGDFIIDNTYTIEVGGAHKNFNQIANIQNSYLAIDDLPQGVKNKIPLWLFGFMY